MVITHDHCMNPLTPSKTNSSRSLSSVNIQRCKWSPVIPSILFFDPLGQQKSRTHKYSLSQLCKLPQQKIKIKP
ncbi:uncharacterized protein BT62DRAFT_489273 [Guyanagaster necrorhizus]|uniref:Uncharacterized protein n=1 Tax=Guyanagaster necrorhizus TaxID=856835 RepID=A0A9P7VHS9_9AGAR|nr:uncharacterized protein BT62DRAFT_489273 [Guyanagaster necrorhizus MCA 3950]KAG7441301.1 hypothetical protein BT62DRAFT_489273 [Guyanagaster necrorhizus MCA 3950]